MKAIGYIIIVITLFISAATSYAYTIPQFPSCTAPQGNIKVYYDTGVHGIPGKSETFKGSDTVYVVSDSTLMQCFCPENGNTGIQTNWWKISTLEEGMVKSLTDQGWIYIPDGSLWGLEAVNYFAKNSEYTCRASSGGGESNSSSSSQEGIGGEASVPAAATAVLGLATTGNSALMAGLVLVGIFLLIIGIILYKVKSTNN